MTWTLFNLQLVFDSTTTRPLDQRPDRNLLQDLTTLVSQLWLQGASCHLTPDETELFTLTLYTILHPNKQCSSSDSNHHQPGAFPLALTGLSLSL